MTKVLKLEKYIFKCEHCLFFREGEYEWEDKCTNFSDYHNFRQMENGKSIPKWCPLPDKKEE